MADDNGTSTDTDVTDGGQQSGDQDTGPQNGNTGPDTDSGAGQQDNQQGSSTDKDDDKTDWKAEAAKWKTLSRKHETKVKELSPLAAKLKEIEDSQKSELDKVKEREGALAIELQKYKVAEIRRAAASAAGLDSEFADLITAADEEEATEQAKRIAERLQAAAKQPGATNFKQGARTSPPPQRTRDALLRGLAGYGDR